MIELGKIIVTVPRRNAKIKAFKALIRFHPVPGGILFLFEANRNPTRARAKKFDINDFPLKLNDQITVQRKKTPAIKDSKKSGGENSVEYELLPGMIVVFLRAFVLEDRYEKIKMYNIMGSVKE